MIKCHWCNGDVCAMCYRKPMCCVCAKKSKEEIKMNELIMNIQGWALARNLHTADPVKQMLKLGEEYGELCSGMARNNEELIKDSIGDMFVVMTILSMQLGIDIQECVQGAYNEIKDRKGRMVDGVFVKESDLSDPFLTNGLAKVVQG